MSADLDLALRLVDVADRISLAAFGSDLDSSVKDDLSPVTEIDHAIEHELRLRLCEERPEDGVLGEELGETVACSGRRWIVDPIDGTRNYLRGVPIWGTLLALEECGEFILGVVSAPALGRRWWAERGSGAFAEGARMRVSEVCDLESAALSLALDNPRAELVARSWHARGIGDFWAHMLVAEGAIDGAVERVGAAEWDLAAVQVIVEEAGGRVSCFAGERRIDRGTCVTSNGRLHDELLRALAA